MSMPAAQERRLLSGDELEVVRASHRPGLASLPPEDVVRLARRLREQRSRLRTQLRAQRRARSGKAEPRSSGGTEEEKLSLRKQAVAGALRRVNSHLQRREAEERRARNLQRLRDALERKRSAPVHHPRPGTTPGEGMHPIEHLSQMTGVEPGKIGSVSQQNKDFQGRRDNG